MGAVRREWQWGILVLVGMAIGAGGAFWWMAAHQTQRAVKALGKAYEEALPRVEVKALPIENPPQASALAEGKEGARSTPQELPYDPNVAFLGVKCVDTEEGPQIVELWPGSGWEEAYLILGGAPPEPYGHHIPSMPAMLGSLYFTCADLAADLAKHKPGEVYYLDLFTKDYPARSEYVVKLIPRPKDAPEGWY